MFQVVITSTIFPQSNTPELVKSVFSPVDRLSQTIETIESLKQLGYSDIYLFDNSGTQYQAVLEKEFAGIAVKTFDHFQFNNKGISEAFLLLAAIKHLPADRPIIKISGRYKLSDRIDFDDTQFDFAAKFYQHSDRLFFHKETMATRCYAVKNKLIFEKYLIALLDEIYAYSGRIFGLGSFKRFLINQFNSNKNSYSYFNANLSVEAASINALQKTQLKIARLGKIGLSGLAGTFNDLLIED